MVARATWKHCDGFFFFLQEAQLKAMKETIQLCLSTVFRDQPPALSLFRVNPTQMSILPKTVDPKIPDAVTEGEVHFIHALKSNIK